MWSFTCEEIGRLVNLRFLKLDGGKLMGGFENTFSKLRWLSRYHCPAEFQATNLKLRNLVVLELSGIFITECWSGWDHIKVLSHLLCGCIFNICSILFTSSSCFTGGKKLKVLNITGCEYLTSVPNFSTFSTVARLILEDCER